jgi:hypothetical protein
MSKEKILVINSKDRSLGTNSDFTLDFKADSSVQQVLKVLVKDVFIPNQFYNINSDNNAIEIKQNAEPNATATISAGQYNINQLITALETAINGVLIDGCIVTITKNDISFKLTFTFSGSGTPANDNVSIILNGTTISGVIGLPADTIQTNIHILTNTFNLNPLQYVQVHSPEIGYLHGLDGGSLISLVETVSLTDTPFGGVGYKQNNDDELCEILYEEPRNLSNIKIVLRDDTGKRLSLPDNHEFSMTLKIYFD